MFHPFRLVRCVLMGANARAALGSPMASVVFTRGHFGTTHAADRLRARESTAECMQGRTRVVMGCPRARIRAHARTAKGARRASAICVVFCSSLAPVWRARANTKTRDYRTIRSRAHIAHKPHARRLTNRRGSRRRNRLLNGFYRSPILSLLAPPAPGLLDLRGIDRSS